MSFILNALRKSEQERQALQDETVKSKILPVQSRQKDSASTKLLIFLALANVLMIVGFVWFVRFNLIAPPNTAESAISPEQSLQEKPGPEATAKFTQPKNPAQKAKSEAASIAELIDREKPEPVNPVITKKPPVADAVKQPAADKNAEPSIPGADEEQSDRSETTPALRDIPFLSDLPFDFRQTVPKFTINVFVYSQSPEERFVMIDMVKYKTGQQIKDLMELQEIRPDSLVVVYQNRQFQIKRP